MRNCRLAAAQALLDLYSGLPVATRGAGPLTAACSSSAYFSTSSNSLQAAPVATSAAAGSTTATEPKARVRGRGRKKYPLPVIEYFAKVKEWNKHVNVLKTEWRTELLVKHREEQARKRAQEIADKQSDRLRASQSRQSQMALEDELKRAEAELELAEWKVQRAHAFEERRREVEKKDKARREVLLEASRTWIRREELLDRINQALDHPMSFGFVGPLADAKKVA